MARQKLIGVPETYSDLTFPIRGLDLTEEFEQQRTGTTPQGTNVRAFENLTQRGRGGSRPGLTKYIPATVGPPSVIQHLNYIVDPSATALLTGFDLLDGNAPGIGIGFGFQPLPDLGLGVNFPTILIPTIGGQTTGGTQDPSDPSRWVRTGGDGYQLNKGVKTKKSQGIKFVQANGNADTTSSLNIAYNASVQTTNLLLVAVGTSVGAPNPEPTLSLTDTLGNHFTQAGSYVQTVFPNYSLSLWYSISKAVGNNTVTVNATGVASMVGVVLEYSGVVPMAFGPLDGTSSNVMNPNSISGAVTTGPVTVGQAGELLFGAFIAGSAVSAGSGFIRRFFQPGMSLSVEDQIGPSPGMPAATGTDGPFNAYVALGASFKPQ